jgi:hypothetical protein
VLGTGIRATVDAFGAVFTDVDLATSSSMQFFDIDANALTGVVNVRVAGTVPTNPSRSSDWWPMRRTYRPRQDHDRYRGVGSER